MTNHETSQESGEAATDDLAGDNDDRNIEQGNDLETVVHEEILSGEEFDGCDSHSGHTERSKDEVITGFDMEIHDADIDEDVHEYHLRRSSNLPKPNWPSTPKISSILPTSNRPSTPGSKYNCGQCSFSSQSIKGFQEHIRVFHVGYQPFECDIPGCSSKYNRCDTLIDHKERVHGIPHLVMPRRSAPRRPKARRFTPQSSKTYKCDLCDFSSFRNGNLSKHMLADHSEQKPIK